MNKMLMSCEQAVVFLLGIWGEVVNRLLAPDPAKLSVSEGLVLKI